MTTLGIIGGGQLGRMLAQAATKLNIKTIVLDPTPDSPAGQVADEQMVGSFTDPKAIAELAKKVDYLTFEIESAEAEILKTLKKQGVKINPSPELLSVIQDKYQQKQLFKKAGIPVAPFVEVKDENDIKKAIKKFNYPVVLKAKRFAYDGRGNAVIKKQSDIAKALKKLNKSELYVEKFIPFIQELATQVGRTVSGKIFLFPLVETIHKNNICHIVKAPAPVEKKVAVKALRVAQKVAKNLKGAGVYGIEMFLTKSGTVLVNEIAPRVHNSGHHTIESCSVSQFEQHVRLVCEMPPKQVDLLTPSVMINILGQRTGKAKTVKNLNLEGVSVHIYGKKETKQERKMGHLTAIGKTVDEAMKRAKAAHKRISI